MRLNNFDRVCAIDSALVMLYQACLASETAIQGLLKDMRGDLKNGSLPDTSLAAHLASLLADAHHAQGEHVVSQHAFVAALKAAVPEFARTTDQDGAEIMMELLTRLPNFASSFAVAVEITITCMKCGVAKTSPGEMPFWVLPVRSTLAEAAAAFRAASRLDESPCDKCWGQREAQTRVTRFPDVLLVNVQRNNNGVTDQSPIAYGLVADIGALNGEASLYDLEGIMRFEGTCQAAAHYNVRVRGGKRGCIMWNNDDPRKELPLPSLLDPTAATTFLLTVRLCASTES
jgi:ubiquitin C-terminal hydrolase